MTDVTWSRSASALLLGHRCAHVVHADALRLPSRSSSAASGSAPGTGATPPRASADDKPAVSPVRSARELVAPPTRCARRPHGRRLQRSDPLTTRSARAPEKCSPSLVRIRLRQAHPPRSGALCRVAVTSSQDRHEDSGLGIQALDGRWGRQATASVAAGGRHGCRPHRPGSPALLTRADIACRAGRPRSSSNHRRGREAACRTSRGASWCMCGVTAARAVASRASRADGRRGPPPPG
jgi:hypothetical protein